MSDGVDAAVKQVEAAALAATIDPAPTEAKRDQLAPCDDPVLATSQAGEGQIRGFA
jgi:hypothetical protein